METRIKTNQPKRKATTMSKKTYLDANNNVVARGTIDEQRIDLIFNDGTRYFATKSDNYDINFLRNLQIAKVK
jgi:hypothetical protein